MKIIYYIVLLISFISTSCNENKLDKQKIKDKETESISSLQNINFLLKYPSSISFKDSIDSYFKYQDSLMDINMWPYVDCFSNCLTINCCSLEDSILVEGHKMLLKDFSKEITKFLIQTEIKEDYSKLVYEKNISKGYFEIITTTNLNYENIQLLFIEISKGLYDYRKQVLSRWYKVQIDDLNTNQQDIIDSLIFNKIVIYKLNNIQTKKILPKANTSHSPQLPPVCNWWGQ